MRLRTLLAAAIVALLLLACRERRVPSTAPGVTRPDVYESAAITATIVDEETGAPIEGVAVMAIWRNIHGHDERMFNVYMSFEAVSDARGLFRIPSWGPRTPQPNCYLDKRDPELYVSKPRYRFRYLDNTGTSLPMGAKLGPPLKLDPRVIEQAPGEFARSSLGSCRWSGTRIALPRVKSDAEAADSLAAAIPRGFLEVAWLEDQYCRTWASAWKDLSAEQQSRVEAPPCAKRHLSAP